MESKKQIAFTDKNIQEISYDLGFKDDAYFNRFFKKRVGQTPKQYRETFDYKHRDLFTQDLFELIKTYHQQERSIGFYATKMNLSTKNLSQKVQSKMNMSLGRLIRYELINSAKLLLNNNETIASISEELGFKEPNHFSRFFKHYSGIAPTEFKQKKYNS